MVQDSTFQKNYKVRYSHLLSNDESAKISFVFRPLLPISYLDLWFAGIQL